MNNPAAIPPHGLLFVASDVDAADEAGGLSGADARILQVAGAIEQGLG
ncbi:hypothetical protein [Cupriavidus sp. AcVe19-6a]|nr:hypothetical protein [Cupriavidus sp. AcVe19-6a]MBP0640129.1 hypothetical protein [Cupriavidus sp. AcVe19-6a]